MSNLSHLLLNKKERNANTQRILNSLNPDQHNFNTMLLGFTDIIQSSFYNHARALCKNDREIDELNARIDKGVNDVLTQLNVNGATNSEDMIIMTTIMLEIINSAMLRQQEVGLALNRNAVRPRKKSPQPDLNQE